MTATANPKEAAPTHFEGVVAREWLVGAPSRPISLSEAESATGVVSVEIGETRSAPELHAALSRLCGNELTLEMLEDLLEPDPLPKVHEYGERRVRSVSAFGVRGYDPDEQGRAGTLVFELVEFLAGERWVLICRHDAEAYAGARRAAPHAESLCGGLLTATEERWSKEPCSSAGDLGVALLHELTCSYPSARRKLFTWLEGWELNFYTDGEVSQEALVELRGLAAELRARLNALNVPNDDAATCWFKGVTNEALARRADRQIDRSLDSLSRFSEMLRGAFELIQTQELTRQSQDMARQTEALRRSLELAEEERQKTEEERRKAEVEREKSEQRQRRLEVAGAAFLVPTLIAGVWGENTWVPGQQHPWGFLLTIGVMVLATLVVLLVLGVFRLRWPWASPPSARADATQMPE